MARLIGSDQIAPGAILSRHLALQGNGGGYLGAFTTTDTTQWVRALSGVTLQVPGLGQLFKTNLSLQIAHSAANARYGISVELYTSADYSGSAYATFLRDYLLVNGGIANEWESLGEPGALAADAAGILTGLRSIDIIVRNRTAGTLYVGAGWGYEFLEWSWAGYKAA